ncbi:AP-4 complex accessory subunit Tepsin [Pleodorina starrii]|nr:AP-4 complex accessory subunit Tepsin [Pleodorina starrii]
MDELAEMARGSAESSEKIADRIAKRLQNKSPVVKFKALRLIRHLLNKGCGQFQRSMQRHANLVREHTHYKGEPDPFKGDTPNQRVRDAAKEASEALFNTVMAQPVTSLGSRIQGFGSSAAPPQPSYHSSNNGAGSGASGAGTSGSRMVGFGSNSSSYAAPAATTSGNGSAGGSSFTQRGVNRPLTGSYGDGGGAGPASGGYGGGGGYTAPPVMATEVLGSEAQLVDSVCTPGGMRLAPDPDDLRRFVEAAGSVDGLKLAELLRDKMESSGPWQQLLRALYALEAVLLQGATQACGEIAVMFQSDPGPVQAAAGHTQAAVRERAGRVLKLLIGDDKPAAAAAAAVQAPAPAPVAVPQAAVDLLGGLDMLGSPVHGGGHSANQPQQQQPQQQRLATGGAAAGTDDIFSGLAVPVGPSVTQQQMGFNQQLHQQPMGGLAALSGHPAPLPQQPPQQHAAPVGASRPPVDPFAASDFLQPAAAPPQQQQQAAYAPQQNLLPQQQQQQQQLQQQPWPVQQQGLQQAYGAVGGSGSGGGMQPKAATPIGPVPGASHAVPVSQHAMAAAPVPQAANVRPPLDDIFADMSLSGKTTAGRPGVAPPAGPGYEGASGAYGGVGGPAYGGGVGVMGYGNPAGTFGTAAPPPPQQQLLQAGRPAAPTHAAAPVGAAGGVDLLGLGPSASGASMGLGAGVGAGGYGAEAGGGPTYGAGAGVGPGSAGMGMGGYPGAPGGGLGAGYGSAVGMGGSGVGGGGMMVGPGGQVRYVGAGGQPPPMMGPANGQMPPLAQHSMAAGQPYGGWQHQPYSVQQQQHQQQQHMMSAGLTPQSQHSEQQRGGAAFDFVRDQFK